MAHLKWMAMTAAILAAAPAMPPQHPTGDHIRKVAFAGKAAILKF